MRVEATKVGFYVKLRSVGDRFEVPDDRFSSTWMQPLDEPKPAEMQPEVPGEPVQVEETPPRKRRGRPPKKAEG